MRPIFLILGALTLITGWIAFVKAAQYYIKKHKSLEDKK